MKDNSTVKKHTFLIDTMLVFTANMMIYNSTGFRCFSDWSFDASRKLFMGVTLVSFALCAALYFKKHRYYFTILTSAATPVCVYTCLAYKDTLSVLIRNIIVLTMIMTLLFSAHFFIKKIARNKDKVAVIKDRAMRCMFFAHTVFTVCMVVMVSRLCFSRLFYNNVLHSDIEKPKGTTADSLLETHKEELMQLDDVIWYTLDTNEKLDVLQLIANIEAEKLGLNNELNVGASNLEKVSLTEGTHGVYRNATHTIMIDLQFLENSTSMDAVDVLTHEAYHSYEFNLVNLYKNATDDEKKLAVFDDVKSYEYELAFPVNSKTDFMGYYNQLTETRSRQYSQTETYFYFCILEELRGGSADGAENTDSPS